MYFSMHEEMHVDSPLEMDVPGFGMQRSKQCSLTFCVEVLARAFANIAERHTSINCLALRTADCWRTSFMMAVFGSADDERPSMFAVVV